MPEAHETEAGRLGALLGQAASFVAVLHVPDLRIELANDAFRRLAGRDDPVGRTMAEAVPALKAFGLPDRLGAALRSGEPFRVSGVRYSAPSDPSGEQFADLIFQPIRDAAGAVTSVFVNGFDTTELTATVRTLTDRDARLRQSEEEFRELGENHPNLCWMAKADGTITWYNRRWYDYTGMTPADLLGWGWQAVHDPAELPRVMAGWTAAIAEGNTFEMTFPLRGADGTFRPFLTRIVPVRDDHGAIRRWLGSNVDISEQQAIAAALRASEAWFRAVQETSIDGFMVLESVREPPSAERSPGLITDFRWVFANAAAERIVGRPAAWFPGRHMLEEMPGNREDGLFDAYVGVVETGVPWTREFSYRHEGMDVYLRAVAAKVGDGFAITFADLSERRRSEEQVRESEARFRVLADSMPQMVWSTLPDGANDYFNARWYDYTGVAFGATAGTRWADVLHPGDLSRARDAWHHSVQTGEPFEIEYRLRRHDGVFRWILARALPQRAADGAIVRWFGTCTDIDDTKQTAALLADSRAELERLVEQRTAALLREMNERRKAEQALQQGEKLQAIGQLTGGIAHDFNNILQVVTSGATLLARPNLDEQRRALILTGMTNAARSAKDLTGRLLAFARKQPLRPEILDVNARLAGMSDILGQTLGPIVAIETDLDPALWLALADASQLEVAVLNLAMNARDAMMPDGGRLRFETRNATLPEAVDRVAGAYICLAVSDTGSGMAPDVLARVFEPFFTTKGLGQGTGLGLAQVHGFTKQSGGDIAVQSAPGQGTTITIHLPRAPAVAVVPEPAAGLVTTGRIGEAAGRWVLVVEDNSEIATFAAGLLEGLGYATRLAANAAEAIAMLETGVPVDAMFSDVVMPGALNGIDLADIVGRRWPRVAVVLASGHTEAATEWTARSGAALLGKPYGIDELAVALARALAAVATAHAPRAP